MQPNRFYRKITLIGNPGSGKSTLAQKLHEIAGIPLYHIDKYDWLPGWHRRDRKEFEHLYTQLCDQDTWIIEGVATRLFEYRAQKADVIIFLDIPTYICLYRVLKRAFTRFGKESFSSPQGCPERGPSLTFLRYIWRFNRDKKPHIEALLEKYQGRKKLFVIKNNADIAHLIKACEADFS